MPDVKNSDVSAQAMTENDYKLLSDSFYGNGGFRAGGYLIQHPREDELKYIMRQELAYYLNYMKPIIKAHVNPIFRKEATRDLKGNGVFSEFLKDVDSNKTSIAKFIQNAAKYAKLNEVSFIVVDSPKVQPTNVAGVIEQRAYPYCYIIKPENVQKYLVTNTGRLTYFSYLEADPERPYSFNLRVWTERDWFLADSSGNKILDMGTHDLGRVPVVVFKASHDEPQSLLPYSEMMPLAIIEKQLYNRCSWWDEILGDQAFSVLTYPGDLANLTLGTNNALSYDPNQPHEPNYISPRAEPCAMLMDEINFLVSEVYRMAGLANVTGVKQALSGIAKQWDNATLADNLIEFAGQCEKAESDIAVLFEAWTQKKVDYLVQYSRDFNALDVATELKNALDAQTLNLGARMTRAIARRAASAYVPGLPEADLKIIEDEAVQGAEDKKNAEKILAYGNDGDQSANNTVDETDQK